MKLTPFLLSVFLCLPLAAQETAVPTEAAYGVNVLTLAKLPATDENIRSLKLPAGFHIAPFATGLTAPRVIVVSDAGNVYVSSRDAGTITMFPAASPTQRKTVIAMENVHGLAIHDGRLYFVTVKEVYSAPILPDGTLGAAKLLMNDLPDAGQHADRTLAFSPDGHLFISVGSTCNECDEKNLNNATMQRANADGSGRTTFATGLRNTIGFAFEPKTGELYGWDDGVDWLGNDTQPEEFNHIEQGKKYGWPYIFGNGEKTTHREPKGKSLDQWDKESVRPSLTWTAHASSMQLLFLGGQMFPAGYNGDALATMHGSWNRNPPSGYEVVHVHFADGKPATVEPFITGFALRTPASKDGWGHFARPFGLAQLKDGSVLLGEELNGIIYRVWYDGK